MFQYKSKSKTPGQSAVREHRSGARARPSSLFFAPLNQTDLSISSHSPDQASPSKSHLGLFRFTNTNPNKRVSCWSLAPPDAGRKGGERCANARWVELVPFRKEGERREKLTVVQPSSCSQSSEFSKVAGKGERRREISDCCSPRFNLSPRAS